MPSGFESDIFFGGAIHIVKPKKISWLRTPEISRFRGFFSRLLAFSQPWGLRIQSAEKKISFQKNGSLQDVEQLSPAAKAQYPFLRAESATFRVAKAFCAPSALFSYFYLLNICVCLKGGSSSVTFIKRKIATAASTTGWCYRTKGQCRNHPHRHWCDIDFRETQSRCQVPIAAWWCPWPRHFRYRALPCPRWKEWNQKYTGLSWSARQAHFAEKRADFHSLQSFRQGLDVHTDCFRSDESGHCATTVFVQTLPAQMLHQDKSPRILGTVIIAFPLRNKWR